MIFVATSVLLYLRGPASGDGRGPGGVGLAMHAKEVAAVGLALVLPLADVLIRRLPRRPRARADRAGAGARGPRDRALRRQRARAAHARRGREGDVLRRAERGRRAPRLGGRAALGCAAPRLPADAQRGLSHAASGGPARRARARRHRRRRGRRSRASSSPHAVRRSLAFAVAWTVAMYPPPANVVPLGPHFVAERYLYVPSFGACLARGPRPRRAPAARDGGGGRRRSRSWWSRAGCARWRACPSGTTRCRCGSRPRARSRGIGAHPRRARPRALARGPERRRPSTSSGARSPRGPEKADTQSNLGLELFKVGRDGGVDSPFRACGGDLAARIPIFHFNLGSALLRSGRHAAALAELRIAGATRHGGAPIPRSARRSPRADSRSRSSAR